MISYSGFTNPVKEENQPESKTSSMGPNKSGSAQRTPVDPYKKEQEQARKNALKKRLQKATQASSKQPY